MTERALVAGDMPVTGDKITVRVYFTADEGDGMLEQEALIKFGATPRDIERVERVTRELLLLAIAPLTNAREMTPDEVTAYINGKAQTWRTQ